MPNFDRSGPKGAGPMTGWGFGRCGGRRGAAATPAGGGFGRAWRRGGRWGFGFGRGYDEPADLGPVAGEDVDPEARRATLKAERNRLKARLGEVEDVLRSIGRGLRGEGDKD